MSSSPWLSGAGLPACVRAAVPLTLLAVFTVGLSACGDEPGAAIERGTSAAAATTTAAKQNCPFTAEMVAQAIRSDVTLLRSAEHLCVYGSAQSPGRADQDQPIAKLLWQDTTVKEARAEAERDRPSAVVSRADLAKGAFSVDQPLKRGRFRETIVFNGDPGSWVVSIDMPAGPDAKVEAADRAEALFDLMQ